MASVTICLVSGLHTMYRFVSDMALESDKNAAVGGPSNDPISVDAAVDGFPSDETVAHPPQDHPALSPNEAIPNYTQDWQADYDDFSPPDDDCKLL